MPICRNFLGFATALTLATPLAAQDVTADTVVATVGEVEITVGHMIAMTATLPDQQLQLPPQVVFDGVLERLIQQEAVTQATPDLTRLTTLMLENERRSLIASERVNEIAARIEVSDADVQAAYDERYADFTPATEYNASHILVETEEEAQEIIDILATGADFAEMAKLKSTGPTGPSGGELGWFGPGRMVPEFENAVVQLEQGQVSPPVQTQYGWHVIRLNDSRQPGIPTLEQVRGELTQEVWNTALEGEIRVLVDSVPVDRADVSGFDPMLAGDLSLLKE